MITIEGLKKKYKKNLALNIQNLNIKAGETIGLVGNNGSGKTTLFNLILDLIEPTEGKVYLKDYPVSASDEWKDFTGAYLDENFLIDFLTPEEYFNFVGNLHGWNKLQVSEFVEKYLDFLGEGIIKDKKFIRELSKGNKSKVGIIAAIIGAPQLLILDEPFAHLDPTSQFKLKNILTEINRNQSTTLLVSCHNLKQVTDLCKRIVLIDKGVIKKDIKTSIETLKELEVHFME